MDEKSAKKNILIFSIAYAPFVGGAEVAVREITDRLGDYEFDMLTARLSPRIARFEKIGNVNVYRLGFGFGFDKYLFLFLAPLKALFLNKKRSYALSWSIMAAYAGFAGLFFKLARPKIPFLLTLQEGDPLPEIEKKVRFIRPIFKKIFLKADHIQAISNFLADWARKIGYKGALSVVPNGVDTQKFKIQPSSRAQVEGNSKFKIAGQYVLYVGAAYPHKNLQGLIKAWKIFNDKYDLDYKLVLVGKRNYFYNQLFNNRPIEQYNNVIYKDDVSDTELVSLYTNASLFVFPSLYEGFGLPPLEAMSHGVPVVSSNRSCMPEVLGEAALYFDPENYEQMADVIYRGLTDENVRFELKNNANGLLKMYSWEKLARETVGVYKEVTGDGR